jgi:hypothetical protein
MTGKKNHGFFHNSLDISRVKKRCRLLIFILCTGMLLTGCGTGGSGNGTEESTLEWKNLTYQEPSMVQSPNSVTFLKDGQVRNPLTGRWIDAKYSNQRPIAVQYENVEAAIPHYGLTFADVTYEILCEDNVTRFMAMFTEYDKVEKFEPIRSDLHYFDRKAVEYDAIHVFCGASDYANENDLYDNQYPYINFIDLLRDPGLNRDEKRYAPHNAYTTPALIKSQIEAKGFSSTHRAYYEDNHKFKEEFSEMEGEIAEIVRIPDFYGRPSYVYYEDDRVYYRYEFGDELVDYQNGYQVWCTNILIQMVEYKNLDGYDEDGGLDLDWSGSGKGYYCTAGRMIPVTWKYSNYSTRWYDMNGNELQMNPGKTWIEVFDNSRSKNGITFEENTIEEDEE